MGRRKCLIIPVLMAGILLMGGCSRQSIEDVKRFQETSTAVENQTNQTGIIQENESRENKVDNVFAGMVSSSPKYAERYSDVDMEIYTGKLVTKFTYSIGETAIAENVDELSKLMSEEDIAEYIKYDTETPEKFSAYDKMINEDGTFANDRKGIKQVALLMKLKITNNGDEDFQFLSNGFRLYCFRYNEQDDATYYSTIESRQSYLNIHDDHEIFRHHLTIKPGETKEVVAMEVIPYEFEEKIVTLSYMETYTPSVKGGKKITSWTSSDDHVAVVSSDGVVEGVSGGTAVITAINSEGKSTQMTVTVEDTSVKRIIGVLLEGFKPMGVSDLIA